MQHLQLKFNTKCNANSTLKALHGPGVQITHYGQNCATRPEGCPWRVLRGAANLNELSGPLRRDALPHQARVQSSLLK
jgi:hypothetical protein